MKTVLFALTAATLLMSGAYAQSRSAEAAPQFDTRPQIAAEQLKSAKRSGIAPIHDGSTADGEGSGVMEFDKAELVAQGSVDTRVAQPHQLPLLRGTPK